MFPASSLLVALSGKGFSGKELTRLSAGSYTFTSPFDTAITITGDGARDFTIAIAGLPQTGCEAALRAHQKVKLTAFVVLSHAVRIAASVSGIVRAVAPTDPLSRPAPLSWNARRAASQPVWGKPAMAIVKSRAPSPVMVIAVSNGEVNV